MGFQLFWRAVPADVRYNIQAGEEAVLALQVPGTGATGAEPGMFAPEKMWQFVVLGVMLF